MALGAGLITFLGFASHIGTVAAIAGLCAVFASGAPEVGTVTSRAEAFTVHCCALDIAGAVSTGLFTESGVSVATVQLAFASSATTFTFR